MNHDFYDNQAATVLSLLPVIILFFILQRDFINGLASGAIKG